MKAASNLIAAGIIILLLYAMILALDQFRLEDRTDYFTVASGATSANVTLTQDLYNDDTQNVSSVSSNVTTDAAVASTYTSSTNVLLISGLDSSASHYLTVVYSIDRLGEYYGAGAASRVLPVLLILGIISIVGGAVFQAYSKVRE